METDDRSIFNAHELDEALGIQDIRLSVARKVVFDGSVAGGDVASVNGEGVGTSQATPALDDLDVVRGQQPLKALVKLGDD